MQRSFQTILITGGCGFIGANFIHYLLKEKNFSGKIINLDLLTYAGNSSYLQEIQENFPDNYLFMQGNICDKDLLKSIFQNFPIEVICHFAAESHVDRSISSPSLFIETNILGTFQLLEASRLYGNSLKLFHHVSTDEVFGSLDNEGFFNENSPYKPNSPYSASKASSDHLARAYFHTYQLPITISNCSNNYGPFQHSEKFIPVVIHSILNEKPIPIYGNGKNIRDWLYVTDHCKGLYQILVQAPAGETYTIGGNTEKTNHELVQLICHLMDKKLKRAYPAEKLICFVKDRPGHDWRYAIDSSKMQTALNWQPDYNLTEGLDKTINWFLN